MVLPNAFVIARQTRIPLLVVTWLSSFCPTLSAEIFRPGDVIPQVNGELFSWGVGDAHSTYSGWVNFSTAGGDPNLVPSTYSPNAAGQFGTPSLLQLNTPGSFFTSGGNLYNAVFPQNFTATVNSGNLGGSNTRIVAQFRTLGTELDYDSILLGSDLGSAGSAAPGLLLETGRVSLGGFGGSQIDYLALWDLESSQEAFRVDFMASGPHLSFGQFHLDTFTQATPFASVTAVPEPTTWAALGVLGLIGFGYRRARGRRHSSAMRQLEEANDDRILE